MSHAGQTRLQNYLQRLQETNGDSGHSTTTDNHNCEPGGDGDGDGGGVGKRKLDDSSSCNGFDVKRRKLSHHDPIAPRYSLCIEDGLAVHTITSVQPETNDNLVVVDGDGHDDGDDDVDVDDQSGSDGSSNHDSDDDSNEDADEDGTGTDDEEQKDSDDDEEPAHHPLYDITVFPKTRLPQVVDPEKTLLPKPVWMEKGKKIITDIGDQSAENAADATARFTLDSLKLDARLVAVLKADGYKSYFPVQINVIPAVIRGSIEQRDIAVCSPTGSGKTLAYVLPICHLLCQEVSDRSHCLRALVVSPSRELSVQLFCVFEKFASSVGVKIGLSAGQKSLTEEQKIIIGDTSLSLFESPFNTKRLSQGDGVDEAIPGDKTAIDVLVCTPGRLVDHLTHTQGFNLQHLHFLVFDEADRLLAEGSHKNWLYRVYQTIESRHAIAKHAFEHAQQQQQRQLSEQQQFRASLTTYDGRICLSSRKQCRYEYKPYLCKILVSATLTHNPKVISSLKLNNPFYFGTNTDKEYLIPSSIEQYFVVRSHNKLVEFLALIDALFSQQKQVVCFCNTVDIAHRLRRVVEIVFRYFHQRPFKVAEFSRLISPRERPHILRRFRAKEIDLLICSNAMARGLDIPSLECVVNYEFPKNAETYVHRIGRTARGIGSGAAYTLVFKPQTKNLLKMLESVENGDKLKQHKLERKIVDFHKRYAEQYIAVLEQILIKEDDAEVDESQPLKSKDVKPFIEANEAAHFNLYDDQS